MAQNVKAKKSPISVINRISSLSHFFADTDNLYIDPLEG